MLLLCRPGEAEGAGAGPRRDADPLTPRRCRAADGQARDATRLCAPGHHRETPGALLRTQASTRRLLPGHCECCLW